jgi:DNA-binding CsgD family transcriptional regulator
MRTEAAMRLTGLALEVGINDHFARMETLTDSRATNIFDANVAVVSDNILWAVLHAFDVLGIGWIACDSDSCVLRANKTAETIFRSGDGLELDHHGVLRTPLGASTSLTDAITRAARSKRFGRSRVSGTPLAVNRGLGKRPLTLLVYPVQKAAHFDSGRRMALVLTLDASACAVTPVELYQLFRLTAQESSIALLLMEGRNLEDCCGELGIDLSIGKSRLRQLFKKTRARHQTELVLTLFKSAAVSRLAVQSLKTNLDRGISTVQ